MLPFSTKLTTLFGMNFQLSCLLRPFFLMKSEEFCHNIYPFMIFCEILTMLSEMIDATCRNFRPFTPFLLDTPAFYVWAKRQEMGFAAASYIEKKQLQTLNWA